MFGGYCRSNLQAPVGPPDRPLADSPPKICLQLFVDRLSPASYRRRPCSERASYLLAPTLLRSCMAQATETRSKGYFRSSPSTAFDQYLQDIQKLPLISDAEEERRLARRAQAGDEKAAERLVTANLRFVISYVK